MSPLEKKWLRLIRNQKEFYGSVHSQEQFKCVDCHTGIHSLSSWTGKKEQVIKICGQCHETKWYKQSVHGQALKSNNPDAAACNDCHNLHDISRLKTSSESLQFFKTKICIRCHSDNKMIERNHVFPLTIPSYENSYHGQSYRLGFPRQVAECSDCHTRRGTSHGILPASDNRSSINQSNITGTCGQCHKGIDADFTSFHVHATLRAPQRYPMEYWT